MNQSLFTNCLLKTNLLFNPQNLSLFSTCAPRILSRNHCNFCCQEKLCKNRSSFIQKQLPNKRLCTSSLLNFAYPCYSTDTNTANNDPNSIPSDSNVEDAEYDSHLNQVLSLDEIYQFLMDENARDIVVIHLSKSINYVDYFIVVTANSYRHLAYMAESLNRMYKQRKSDKDRFRLIEGKRTSKDWQCIDFGSAVVHFMLEEVRQKYELEKLWILGPEFDDLTLETPTLEELLEKVSDQGLFLLSDPGDSAEYVDNVEIVNPWEIEYKSEEDFPDKLDEDEDAYII